MTLRKSALIKVMVSLAIGVSILIAPEKTGVARAEISTSSSTTAGVQGDCPIILSDGKITVAPNQPAVPNQSTVGIVNALCDVTLDFVGCGFTPTAITLACDTNGDAAPDVLIPLKNIKMINGLLVQATLPSLASTPGTAFPLVCCGGQTTIMLTRSLGAGDDNTFGSFTQTITCSIDLGIRAPVVISATPSDGDCSTGQNLLIPGACFVLANGKPNVTSVFAVDAANPSNVIQASAVEILSPNLLDAFFPFGPASAGKTFLIFASGPNGTSRNMTQLPSGAPAGCPLGNEQGVKVSFTCKSASGAVPVDSPPSQSDVLSCKIERSAAGVFTLVLSGKFKEGGTVTVGGVSPKKIKLKGFNSETDAFGKMILKGRVCENLPGQILYLPPGGAPAQPFQCTAQCSN